MAIDPITGYDTSIDKLQGQLDSSPSYYGAYGEPDPEDVSVQANMKKLEAARQKLITKQLSEKWYGPNKPEEQVVAEPQQNLWIKTLDAIASPLYGQVGAAKWLVGKAEPGMSLADSINKNMTENKETWGALMREFNMPLLPSMALGFFMDVKTDPLNIFPFFGAGEAGLVGKTLKGYKGAGIEGAQQGARTVLIRGMSKMINRIPGLAAKGEFEADIDAAKVVTKATELLNKMDASGAAPEEIASKLTGFINQFKNPRQALGTVGSLAKKGAENLRTAALESQVKFEKMTESIADTMTKRAAQATFLNRATNMFKALPGGDKLYKLYEANLKYDPANWLKESMFKDDVLRYANEHNLIIGKEYDPLTKQFFTPTPERALEIIKNFGTSILEEAKRNPEFYKFIEDDVEKWLKESATFAEPTVGGMTGDLASVAKEIKSILKQGEDIAGTGQMANIDTTAHNALKMVMEAKEESYFNGITKAYEKMAGSIKEPSVLGLRGAIRHYQSGSEMPVPLTQMFPRVADFEIWGKNVGVPALRGYELLISIFKSAKVSLLNLSSMVYATIGNAAMAHMAGINVLRPEYRKLLKLSWDFNMGKVSGNVIAKYFESPEMRKFMKEYPETFAKIMGFSTHKIELSEVFQDALGAVFNKEFKDSSEIPMVKTEMVKQLEDFVKKDATLRGLMKKTSYTERYLTEGIKNQSGLPVNLATVELTGTEITKLMTHLGDIVAKDPNSLAGKAAAAMKWGLDQSKVYQKIDQSYRLATIVMLTHYGLSEEELTKLSRMMAIKGGDISTVDAAKNLVMNRYKRGEEFYYRLSPEKAFEAADEIYMNYAAMPAAVKLIRQLPIIGHPFFSFQYLMAHKALKTLVYNPTAYNKVTFLLNEIQGDKSPIEKAALNDKYYQWYKTTPGMISLSAIPFLHDNPAYLNVANWFPYLQMNMFNPSERQYGKGLPQAMANFIDASPLLKNPIGQMAVDYFIMPTLLGGSNVQNQFGGPLYPSDAPGWQKYGTLPLRTLAESFVPSVPGVAAAMPLALPWKGALMDVLPVGYQGRKVGRAMWGETPVGIPSKENAFQKWSRSMASVLGLSTQMMDTTYTTSQTNK